LKSLASGNEEESQKAFNKLGLQRPRTSSVFLAWELEQKLAQTSQPRTRTCCCAFPHYSPPPHTHSCTPLRSHRCS